MAKRVIYRIKPAPGETLELDRSGPYGYFVIAAFHTWDEYADYRDGNPFMEEPPNELVSLLPPGWAGTPADEDVLSDRQRRLANTPA